MTDLGLILADKNMEYAVRGICSRSESLAIRTITIQTKVLPGRDGGTRTTGPDLLRLWHGQILHGIVMLDWDGSGASQNSAIELETDLDTRIAPTWGDRAKAIVIDPELDGWMWGSDNVLKQVLDCDFPIREWLRERNFEFAENGKPILPKNAMDALMTELRRPRSSATYKKIADRISLNKCVDPAFVRFRATLQRWFPPVV